MVTQTSGDILGWWVIAGLDLLGLLRRVEAGESADLVFAEAYANAEIDPPEDD